MVKEDKWRSITPETCEYWCKECGRNVIYAGAMPPKDFLCTDHKEAETWLTARPCDALHTIERRLMRLLATAPSEAIASELGFLAHQLWAARTKIHATLETLGTIQSMCDVIRDSIGGSDDSSDGSNRPEASGDGVAG